jgi:hypothetical protein
MEPSPEVLADQERRVVAAGGKFRVARLVGVRRFGAGRGGAVLRTCGRAGNGSFIGKEYEDLVQGVSCADLVR